MGESARVSRRVLGPGSQGRRLRRAPGGLGRRCGGAGVVEQTQLRQARGGRSGSERPRGESFPVPASVGAVPRGCGRGGGRGGRAGWSGAPCAPVLPRCSEVRAEGARTPIPPQAPLPARWGAADAAWECSRCRSPPPTLAQALRLQVGPGLGPRPDSPHLRPTPCTPRERGHGSSVGPCHLTVAFSSLHPQGWVPASPARPPAPHRLTEGPRPALSAWRARLGLSWV